MSYLELLPNLASQILCLNPIEFRFAKRMKKIVDCLVVGVVHIPRAWGKEVYGVVDG
jgi:hypothetical protein